MGGEGVQRVLKHRCKGVECLMEEWSVLCAPLSKHYGTAVSVCVSVCAVYAPCV